MRQGIWLVLLLLIPLLLGGRDAAAAPHSQVVGAPGSSFSYQGQLVAGDTPVEGTCDLRLALFDAAVDGLRVGEPIEARSTEVLGGLFMLNLDFGPDALLGGERFLEIEARCPAGVGSFDRLEPRQPITPAPFAFYAQRAEESENVTGDITPASVSVGGGLIIDNQGRWVGDPTGLIGPQGEAGPRGEAGPEGEPGPRGEQGPQGDPGTDGADGAPGPQGARGPQGDPGAPGQRGPQGDEGARGSAGPSGPQGSQGETGPRGAPGPQGEQGPQGLRGAKGDRGATGLQGLPGEIRWPLVAERASETALISVVQMNVSKMGIHASSGAGIGIHGWSDTGFAVMGESHRGTGVRGTTGSPTAGRAGVHGSSAGGTGVLGESQSNLAHAAGVIGKSTRGMGVRGETLSSDHSDAGVYGKASNGINTAGVSGEHTASGIGLHGKSSNYAGWFDGSVRMTKHLNVNGNLSKAGGSFKIDHPLDPANKYLYHSFVESPDMKNIYDGVVSLDADGRAEVALQDWFETLNREYRYQLTPMGAPAPGLYIAQEVEHGRFAIAGGQPGMRVSWQVTGIRQDVYAEAHRIPVEEDKPTFERGYYLHPELHGQPASRTVESAEIAGAAHAAALDLATDSIAVEGQAGDIEERDHATR